MVSDPEKLLRDYERGYLVRVELLIHLVQAATVRNPTELAAPLSDDVLAELREQSATPPASVQGIRRFTRMGGSGLSDADLRREWQLYFDGLWQWHRYFKDARGA